LYQNYILRDEIAIVYFTNPIIKQLMEKQTNCPNCNAVLKAGWASNSLVNSNQTSFINSVLKKESPAYCDKCAPKLYEDAEHIWERERNQQIQNLERNIDAIPIISTHTPYGWEYETISIVTGQSVTGTGVISEFTSDFSDFFGGQSGSFNKKLSDGEQRCFQQLRAKALRLGSNAIIATDIDYGEAGAGKGMLMVCAAGTAVKLKNTAVLGEKAEAIENLLKSQERLEELDRYRNKWF